jgi:hypothetical protein
MVEVYVQTRPPVGRRANVAAAGLLILVCLLAWWMGRDRAERPMRPRIEPAGWSISFEAPFRRSQQGRTQNGYAFSYFEQLPDDTSVVVVVHRVEPRREEKLIEVAERIALSFAGRTRGFLGDGPVFWFDKSLGPYEAVQVWEPQLRVLVRAARSEFGDEIYAVSVQAERWLDPALYALLESVTDSVQPR